MGTSDGGGDAGGGGLPLDRPRHAARGREAVRAALPRSPPGQLENAFFGCVRLQKQEVRISLLTRF